MKDIKTTSRRTSRLVILLFAGIVLSLSSCKTHRSVIKGPIKEKGADYLINRLKENELKFNTLSARFSATYVYNKKKTDFRGQIRIKNDSAIWISITPALGLEMVRLLITNDSVRFMNRMDKVYFEGDYAYVNNFLKTNINYDILQSLITGNDFKFYDDASFRASIDSREYRLSTTGRRKIRKAAEPNDTGPLVLIQNIWLNPENFKISRVDVKEYQKDNKKLEAHYNNFVEMNSQLFPTLIQFSITADNPIDLTLDYGRITLDQPLSFPFTIPSKYDRIR